MTMKPLTKLLLAGFGALLLASCGTTGSSPVSAGTPVSGTVRFTSNQILAYGSVQSGDGVLAYRGRKHPFTVSGVGVGGMGIQSMTAAGNVYNLDRASDFEGTYAQARLGMTIGSGRSNMWLKNEKGVSMHVKANTQGLALATGAEGMVIKFK